MKLNKKMWSYREVLKKRSMLSINVLFEGEHNDKTDFLFYPYHSFRYFNILFVCRHNFVYGLMTLIVIVA